MHTDAHTLQLFAQFRSILVTSVRDHPKLETEPVTAGGIVTWETFLSGGCVKQPTYGM